MKAWVNKYIESLREEYGKGIEIKEFGKSFYVYNLSLPFDSGPWARDNNA
ncbi:MAG: hypothetical protein AB1391_04765 [Candidatus Micrarchaeota archaeon]